MADNKASLFWDKFITIKDRLMDIDSLSEDKAEELLLLLDGYLKDFSQGVDFILSDLTANGRDILLTANGDEEFFQDVIELVQSAPVMDFWTVTAFLQPQGKNQSAEYEDTSLNSKDLYFIPMESDEQKDKIGLMIAGKNLQKNDEVLSCAYLLCEKMIGEYNATTLTGYFDVGNLPDNFEDEGYLPLDYLPDFIQWKIDSLNKTDK
ncbi:MAG: hypothetical protein J6P44_00430 [Bacteroidales bacterium]|nr:hypothetical protein [Bacteroidales bacterium]